MQYNAKRENDVLRFGNNINDDKQRLDIDNLNRLIFFLPNGYVDSFSSLCYSLISDPVLQDILEHLISQANYIRCNDSPWR